MKQRSVSLNVRLVPEEDGGALMEVRSRGVRRDKLVAAVRQMLAEIGVKGTIVVARPKRSEATRTRLPR